MKTLILFLTLTLQINATRYYVKTTGNDTDSGLSDSSAWKTFAKVIGFTFNSGDTVSFNCGDRFLATDLNNTTSFKKSNITVNSYGTGARPVIDGGGNTVPTDGIVIFELGDQDNPTYNVTLNGIKIVNGYKCNIGSLGINTIIESCNIDSNAYMDRNIFNGNPGGIYAGEVAQNCIIRNSTISYNRGGNGYYIDGADNFLLEYDTVNYNQQSGIRVSWGTADSGYTDNLTIRYCIVRFNGGDTASFGYAHENDGMRNSNVYYNLFESSYNACGAMNLYEDTLHEGHKPPTNCNYYNNTFITHGAGYAIQINTYTNMTGMVFMNNIFNNDAGTYGVYFFNSSSKPNNWTFNNNCYYGDSLETSTFWHLGDDRTFSYWQNTLGYDVNGLNTNPLFNTSGDYLLQSSSPCINAGTNVGLTHDIIGNLVHNPPGIGAFEVPQLNLTALIEAMFVNSETKMFTTPPVTVELHNATSPFGLIEFQTGNLSNSGVGTFNFSTEVNGTPYYIVIKSVNTIETWSATTQSFTSGALSYDFTTTQSQAYGSNLIKKGTKWCIYSGDVNQDGLVDLSDLIAIDKDNTNYVTGYVNTDVNGDGIVDLSDLLLVDTNIMNHVSKKVPAAVPGFISAKRVIKSHDQQKKSVN